MKYPSIWYTIWLLEALPVVCNTVYVKTFLYFTLLYSRLFLWVEEAQEDLQNDISWCNSDWLTNMNFTLEATSAIVSQQVLRERLPNL